MKTWKKEMFVMGLVLALSTLVAALVEGQLLLSHILTALAVLSTFGHAQVSDRLRAYALSGGDAIPPECAAKERYYYWAKECLWVLAFLSMHNYPALIGTFGFLHYPHWRAYHARAKG